MKIPLLLSLCTLPFKSISAYISKTIHNVGKCFQPKLNGLEGGGGHNLTLMVISLGRTVEEIRRFTSTLSFLTRLLNEHFTK